MGPTGTGQDRGRPPYSGDIDGAVGFGDVGTTPHGANIGPLRGFGFEARGVQEGGGQDAWGHGGLGYPSNGQVDNGQVCHLQKDCLVSGNVMVAERDSLSQSEYGNLKPVQNGEMLNSPKQPLRPDWTDSRGTRRQHADQDPGRNVVNAAAEKLRHGLGQAASYPLRWIKRAQSSPSPPSPPPPSVEGYRSPVGGIPEGYQREVIQTWNGGTPGTMCPDRPSHVTPNRNMVCGYSSYISGEFGSLPRVPAEENTVLNAPRTIYGAAGHVIFPTKSGLPYPQHGDRPAGTEQQQETMRPEYPLYGRFNNTATSQTSPEKPKNHMEDPEFSNSVVMNSGPPQSGLTLMKPNSPNLPQRSKPRPANHLAYSAPVPTSRPTLTQPKSPRGEDTVHCILERISNMERLLEEEISAERALLTKCLLEFQKLLGGGNMETRDGDGLFGKQNERVEDTREEKQPQHKRLELSSKHRDVARSGKNGSPPDKIKGQEISPRSKTCAQKSSEKKYFKHHGKKHGELKDKHLRNSTGKLNASRKHQSSPVNSSGSAEGANIDNDSNCDNHEHAPYNEITTSCSLTGTWEDTTSTCHVENGTENTHHGLVSYLKSNEKWQTYETSVKDSEQVQRITKCFSTENERPKSPRSPRSLPDPDHRSKKGQYCDLAEKKLQKSFHQAQKAMLHMMVERVNAHLLAMSALERMDSNSGNSSSHHQQELQTRDCEPDLALVPVLNPTVKPFKVSNKSSDGPRDACELNQGKAKSQLQSTTTQTCDMENLVDHSTLLPCLSGREPNEKSPKDSVQHRKVATLDLAPELVSSPAQTSNHASDQPMQHGQLEFTQPQIAEPTEQRQLQQTFQQLSEQASNLMDIPLAKDFSPQRKPIPPIEIHPSRLLETRSGEAQAAKIQQIIHEGQHPGQYGFSSTILQQDPTFLQLPRVSWRNRDGIICPLDFLRTHQLTSHHPDFLYPCPTEPRTAQDGLPRVCPGQPGSLPYTNFLCGEGDILPPSGHLQFDPQCPIHGVMEPAMHRGHTAQVVCSQQKQDNFIQQFQLPVHHQQRQSTPPQEHPWQEQQQQHHHEPLEPQVQYQHHLQQHVDGDHQMEQMHTICQPETQSHHHQRHHIQQQYSNHLLPQTEGPLHHRHDPYKTNSNHKINLPNSCPTVAFISAGDHPEQVFSHKQAHRSVLACPSFPSTPPAGWADNPGPVSWIPQPSAGQTPCTNSKTKSRSQVSPRKVGTGVKDSTVYEDSVAAIEKVSEETVMYVFKLPSYVLFSKYLPNYNAYCLTFNNLLVYKSHKNST